MWLVLRKLRPGLTVHGFRSTFRTWAEERTAYPREVWEQALAHTIGSAVERAYRRTDLLERRARLMADWATFCTLAASEGEVVPLRAPLIEGPRDISIQNRSGGRACNPPDLPALCNDTWAVPQPSPGLQAACQPKGRQSRP
jgi:hypothetical protein